MKNIRYGLALIAAISLMTTTANAGFKYSNRDLDMLVEIANEQFQSLQQNSKSLQYEMRMRGYLPTQTEAVQDRNGIGISIAGARLEMLKTMQDSMVNDNDNYWNYTGLDMKQMKIAEGVLEARIAALDGHLKNLGWRGTVGTIGDRFSAKSNINEALIEKEYASINLSAVRFVKNKLKRLPYDLEGLNDLVRSAETLEVFAKKSANYAGWVSAVQPSVGGRIAAAGAQIRADSALTEQQRILRAFLAIQKRAQELQPSTNSCSRLFL